ncbi:MAG: hypothetical protein ACO3CU_04550, partial [Candidatus Nanopelagicales bacterium]
MQALIVLIVWVVTATALKGVQTQELSTATDSPFTAILRDFAAAIRGNRTESPLFIYIFNPIRSAITGFIEVFMGAIAIPGPGNVIPLLGWFGTLMLVGFIVYATSTLRMALVSMFLLFLCGMLGMWALTMETLAMTIGAVVLSLAIALPLGVWGGLNDRVMKVLRPWLDLAQVLPTLVYLAPLALVFLIGIASATIATIHRHLVDQHYLFHLPSLRRGEEGRRRRRKMRERRMETPPVNMNADFFHPPIEITTATRK